MKKRWAILRQEKQINQSVHFNEFKYSFFFDVLLFSFSLLLLLLLVRRCCRLHCCLFFLVINLYFLAQSVYSLFNYNKNNNIEMN